MTGGEERHAMPRSPWLGRERLAGLVLLGFGVLTLAAGARLPFFTSGGVGSGLMPRSLSVIVIGLGLLQLWLARANPGPSTGAWSLGRAIPVAAGAILFALTIRGFDIGGFEVPELGLAVAAPLTIIVAGLADKDARLGELLIFAVVLSACCIGIFRYALGLSIPVAPWLIGY